MDMTDVELALRSHFESRVKAGRYPIVSVRYPFFASDSIIPKTERMSLRIRITLRRELRSRRHDIRRIELRITDRLRRDCWKILARDFQNIQPWLQRHFNGKSSRCVYFPDVIAD